jgi:hypothetical protein
MTFVCPVSQEPPVEMIYNHVDSNFTYSTEPPGCAFLRYEMNYVAPDQHFYNQFGTEEGCTAKVSAVGWW